MLSPVALLLNLVLFPAAPEIMNPWSFSLEKWSCKLFDFVFETFPIRVSTVIHFTMHKVLCMENVRSQDQKTPEISFFIEIFFIRGLPCLKKRIVLKFFFSPRRILRVSSPLLFSAPVDSWNQFLIAFSMRKTFFNKLFRGGQFIEFRGK